MKSYFIKGFILLAAVALTGCGGAGSDQAANTAPDSVQSATYTWVAPATRVDGSSLLLSDIASYKVYMGADAANLEVYDVASATEYNFYDLQGQGELYFAVTAVDVDGIESALSEIKTGVFL